MAAVWPKVLGTLSVLTIAVVTTYFISTSKWLSATSGSINQKKLYDHDYGWQWDKELVPGKFHLFWRATGKGFSDVITFKVVAATVGWVGLGFSTTGSMKGSDIVIGGVYSNGSEYLWDRHGIENEFPPMDKIQDYKLLTAKQNESHVMLIFQRKLVTGDEEDMELGEDTVKLIWAYNNEDPKSSNELLKHTEKGTKAVQLFSHQFYRTVPLPMNAQTVDVMVQNVSIAAAKQTTYYCKFSQLPKMPKQHLIRYDPIIPSGQEAFVHHILVFVCPQDLSAFIDREGVCTHKDDRSEKDFLRAADECRTSAYLALWNLGDEPTAMPEDVGTPFGGDESRFLLLEVHFDNSKHEKVIASAGLRLYYTDQLRKYDAGALGVWAHYSPYQLMIPPMQKQLTYHIVCTEYCTSKLPKDGITVYSVIPHMHKLGKRIRIRVVRNGVEIPELATERNWVFDNQLKRDLTQSVMLFPNDIIIVECDFDSENLKTVTLNGMSTFDEMCSGTLYYYPRFEDLSVCIAGPTNSTFASALNVTLANTNASSADGYFVVEPRTGKPIDILEYAKKKDWKTAATGELMSEDGKYFQTSIQTLDNHNICAGKEKGSQKIVMTEPYRFVNKAEWLKKPWSKSRT